MTGGSGSKVGLSEVRGESPRMFRGERGVGLITRLPTSLWLLVKELGRRLKIGALP